MLPTWGRHGRLGQPWRAQTPAVLPSHPALPVAAINLAPVSPPPGHVLAQVARDKLPRRDGLLRAHAPSGALVQPARPLLQARSGSYASVSMVLQTVTLQTACTDPELKGQVVSQYHPEGGMIKLGHQLSAQQVELVLWRDDGTTTPLAAVQ